MIEKRCRPNFGRRIQIRKEIKCIFALNDFLKIDKTRITRFRLARRDLSEFGIL